MSRHSIPTHLRHALAALPPGALCVGFSGGMDSSALLHALASEAGAHGRGLRAIHVDHALHAHSAQWAAQCTGFAQRLGIALDVVRVRVSHDGGGLEDAARAARMAAFAQTLQPGEILALAQHRDDQAETVLLKLLRGAGPEGLGGMRALRDFGAGRLWRPLLDLPRRALLDYAQRHDLRWIDDPSNADTRLRRNFLRGEILPRLRQRWPDADVALAHSAAWARHAADFIDAQARTALADLQGGDPATLRWRGWLALPDALRDPVLRLWLRGLHLDEPAHFHRQELERQLRQADDDKQPCVGFAGTRLRRYREYLHALRPLPPLPENWQTHWDGSPLRLPDGSTLRLASDARLAAPLQVRYRRGGERLKPAGRAHTRELRLLMQETGIPPWQRPYVPLVFRDGELIAIGDGIVSQIGKTLLSGITWNKQSVKIEFAK